MMRSRSFNSYQLPVTSYQLSVISYQDVIVNLLIDHCSLVTAAGTVHCFNHPAKPVSQSQSAKPCTSCLTEACFCNNRVFFPESFSVKDLQKFNFSVKKVNIGYYFADDANLP